MHNSNFEGFDLPWHLGSFGYLQVQRSTFTTCLEFHLFKMFWKKISELFISLEEKMLQIFQDLLLHAKRC